jgi:thioester reductase-like protein
MQILVTGASGLVGAEVSARLAEIGHAVVALKNQSAAIQRYNGKALGTTAYADAYPAAGGVAVLSGDIRKERLGLSDQAYATLVESTDLIIHSAALTSFGRPAERYQAINVEGTQRMVDIALAGAAAPIPLVYVSTMYVCGERPGLFGEGDYQRGQSFGSPYEASKFRAEGYVRDAMTRGLPAVIARPSIIVGHSKNGVIRKFDTIYSVYRLTTSGLVRTIPGDYGATVDIVPVDWVADGIAAVAQNLDAGIGQTLHLCSGAPLSLRDINDVCAEFPSFNVPRFVPGHVFHAYRMRGLEKRYYQEVVSLYESYFRRQVVFVRDTTDAVVKSGPACSGKALLRRIFQYAVNVGYFSRGGLHA